MIVADDMDLIHARDIRCLNDGIFRTHLRQMNRRNLPMRNGRANDLPVQHPVETNILNILRSAGYFR